MSQQAEGQLYNLKWMNHTKSLLQTICEQLQDEILVDVTLSCEGKFLKAHKMVLSACSPYFMELFKVHSHPNPCIILNGVRFEILQFVLAFMYDGEIKVSETDLEELLVVAETLKVKGLGKVRHNTSGKQNSSQEVDAPVVPMAAVPIKEESPEILPVTPACLSNPAVTDTVNSFINPTKKRRKQSLAPLNDHEHAVETNINGILFADENGSLEKIPKLHENDSANNKNTDRYGSKIPRPPNAFMIFANEFRKKLATENSGDSNKEVSVRLGALWRNLEHFEKARYYEAAKRADQEHKIRYPDYSYSPKEARIRKEQKLEKVTKPTTILKKSEPLFMYLSNENSNKQTIYEIRDEGKSNENSNSSDDTLQIDED